MRAIKLCADHLSQVRAPEIEEGRESSFADRLAELGLTDLQIDAVDELAGTESERRGFHYAAAVLQRMFAFAAERSIFGASLYHAFGFSELSLDELADRFGVSKQAVGNVQSRIRNTIGVLIPDAPPPTRARKKPDAPGEWLTVREASRLANASVPVISHAGRMGNLPHIEHDNQHWYEEAEVLKWAQAFHTAEKPKHRGKLSEGASAPAEPLGAVGI